MAFRGFAGFQDTLFCMVLILFRAVFGLLRHLDLADIRERYHTSVVNPISPTHV